MAKPRQEQLGTITDLDKDGSGTVTVNNADIVDVDSINANDGYLTEQISIGSTTAQSGAVRFSNNASMAWRNAANTEDVVALSVNVSDEIEVGTGGDSVLNITAATSTFSHGTEDIVIGDGLLSVGSNAASTGSIRLSNTGDIYARNNANDGNSKVLGFTSSDTLEVGDQNYAAYLDGETVTIRPGGFTFEDRLVVSELNVSLYYDTNAALSHTLGMGSTPFLSFGASAANEGNLRLPNEGTVYARNDVDSSNIQMLSIGSNAVQLGSSSWETRVLGSSAVTTNIDGYSRLTVLDTASNFTHGTETVSVGDGFISIGNTPASTGALRLENTNTIQSRNNTDSQDIVLLSASALNEVQLGSSSWGTSILGSSSVATRIGGSSRFTVLDTASNFTHGTETVSIGDGFISIGNTPASTGALRLENNTDIVWRASDDMTDVAALSVNASDELEVDPPVQFNQHIKLENLTSLPSAPSSGGQIFHTTAAGFSSLVYQSPSSLEEIAYYEGSNPDVRINKSVISGIGTTIFTSPRGHTTGDLIVAHVRVMSVVGSASISVFQTAMATIGWVYNSITLAWVVAPSSLVASNASELTITGTTSPAVQITASTSTKIIGAVEWIITPLPV